MASTDESTKGKLERLQELRDEALHAGSEKAVERQREAGKMLARERVEKLLDPGSFVELDRYVRHRNPLFGMMDRRPYGDAVVTGYGDDLRPQGLRLLAGLHDLRRQSFGGFRREDRARSWTSPRSTGAP